MASWSGISSLPLSRVRHLDGVSVEASIADIVAGCDGQDRKFPHTISQVAEGTQPQLGSMASDALQESTGRVLPMPALSPPGVTCSSSDCELLIQRLMEVVRTGRSGIQERPQGPDIGLGLRSLLRFSAIPGMDAPTLVPGLEGGILRHQYSWNPSWRWFPRCGGGIECVSPVVTRDMG